MEESGRGPTAPAIAAAGLLRLHAPSVMGGTVNLKRAKAEKRAV